MAAPIFALSWTSRVAADLEAAVTGFEAAVTGLIAGVAGLDAGDAGSAAAAHSGKTRMATNERATDRSMATSQFGRIRLPRPGGRTQKAKGSWQAGQPAAA
jgi:hypothetical protein